MARNVFNIYEDQIKDYNNLLFDEAKKLLEPVKGEINISVKNKTINEVFNGTIHYVIDFIKKCGYEKLQSGSYDLNDVINGALLIWYKKISSFDLLKYANVSLALESLANGLINELIYNTKNHNSIYDYNTDFFNDLLELYINLRNKKDYVSFEELIKEYNKQNNGKIYDDYWRIWSYIYSLEKKYNIGMLKETLEICYKYLSKNDTEEVNISKKNITRLSKLLQEQTTFELLNPTHKSSELTEEKAMEKTDKEDINKLVFEESILLPNEKSVIVHRFGFNGNEEKTLREIAEMKNVSGPRIRKIEQKALRKLRDVDNSERLKDFYN